MYPLLLGKRNRLLTRRNIIIYMVAVILVMGISAGFTNAFVSDSRRVGAGWGETIVMEAAPPQTGSPEDFDLISNFKFSAYTLHNTPYFRGFTKGVVSADIGLGSYTQHLTNTRVVYNKNTVFTETVSSSSLKSLAEQKYADNGVIIYRPSSKISGGKATFASTAAQMSYKNYSESYGTVPNQLSKYLINEETVIGVCDENASVLLPLNADGSSDGADGASTFPAPERLIKNADGNYVFTLTLDPEKSSVYYRNEVRTLGGADSNPKFHSVKITVTIDDNWMPVSVRTYENYDIEIPVLGAMNCSGDNYEEFFVLADGVDEIPEKDFFQPYVDRAKADPDFVPPDLSIERPASASDYLASAFADYISGAKDLDLKVDVKVGSLSLYDLVLSLNLDSGSVRAMLGNGLYVGYEGDKVYLNVNKLNGYLSTAQFGKLLSDSRIKALMSGMGGMLGADGKPNLDKLFGGDILDVIFRNCDMTTNNGITNIPLSFELDLSSVSALLGKAKVDAAILINDDGKSLKSITGAIKLGSTEIKIDVRPIDVLPIFPSLDGAVDLSPAIDFVPDILATAMQTTYGIDGKVVLNGLELGVSAYIDRSQGDLAAQATLSLLGMDIDVTYVGDCVYATVGNIAVRGTIDELPELIGAIGDIAGFNKYSSLIGSLLPSSINDFAKMVMSMTVDERSLDLRLGFIGIPIDIELTRSGGKLDGVALDVAVDKFGIKADIAADLALSEPEKREITPPAATEFITFAQLATIVKDFAPYLKANVNYIIDLSGFVQADGNIPFDGHIAIDRILDKKGNTIGISAKASLSVLENAFELTYVDGIAYAAIGNIKVKINPTDINSLVTSIKSLVAAATGKPLGFDADVNAIVGAVLAALDSLAINDEGAIELVASPSGGELALTVRPESGKITLVGDYNGCGFGLDLTVAASANKSGIVAPEDAEAYIDLAAFAPALDTVAELISTGSASVVVDIAYGGTTYRAILDVEYGNGLNVRAEIEGLPIEIVLYDGTIYLSAGEIRLKGTVSDIRELYAELVLALNLPSFDVTPLVSDIPAAIGYVLGAISTPTLADGALATEIALEGYKLDFAIRTDLSAVNLSTAIGADEFFVALGISAGCDEITAPIGEYSSIAGFKPLVPAICAIAKGDAFAVDFDASIGADNKYAVRGSAVIAADGSAVGATVNALGQNIELTYVNEVAYIELGPVKLKLAAADIDRLIPSVRELLAALGVSTGDSSDTKTLLTELGSINGIIAGTLGGVKTFTVKDGVIELAVEYNGNAINLELAPAADNALRVDISAVAFGTQAALAATFAATGIDVVAPENVDAYSDIVELVPTIDAAVDILENGGIAAYAGIVVADKQFAAKIELSFKDGLSVRITEQTLSLEVVLIGDTLYVALGDIRVYGTFADAKKLIDAVRANLPAELTESSSKTIEQIVRLLPSASDIETDGKTDVAKLLDCVLGFITELSIENGRINIAMGHGGLNMTIGMTTALERIDCAVTACIADADGIGNFGARLALADVVAKRVNIVAPDSSRYVALSTVHDAIGGILPLVKQKSFDISFKVTAYARTIFGRMYVDLADYNPENIRLDASIDIAGVNVAVKLVDKSVYIDIAEGGIRLVQSLEKADIAALVAELDAALPALDLVNKLGGLTGKLGGGDAVALLKKLALSPTNGGMTLGVSGAHPVSITFATANGVLDNIVVGCAIAGKPLVATIDTTIDDGTLTAVSSENIDIFGAALGFDVSVIPTARRAVVLTGKYIEPREFVKFIGPVIELASKAAAAGTAVIDIETTLSVLGKETVVTGTIYADVKTFAVGADLLLFADSADPNGKLPLSVRFVNGVLYIRTGEIALSLDTASDIGVLYNSIKGLLPAGINALLGNLGSVTTASSLINSIKSLAKAPDIATAVGILFDANNAFERSMIKQVADMLRLFKRGEQITVGITVMEVPFAIDVNVSPVINGGKLDVKLDTSLNNMLGINATIKPSFERGGYTPDIVAAEYTPLVRFATGVVDAVNTVTARVPDKSVLNSDGSITETSKVAFVLNTFAFDYDIFRKKTGTIDGVQVELKDDAGRPVIERDGKNNKIVEKRIIATNKPDCTALRFSYAKSTTKKAGEVTSVSTALSVEAHVAIDIEAPDGNGGFKKQLGFPIELDLYLAPSGLAYLYYKEANGFGEKISIDYTSIMQLVAAVMDIMGASDDTVETVLGKYRLPIDTTVFDSMKIAGLDGIAATLDNLVKALGEGKLALADIKKAWSRMSAAEDINALVKEFTNSDSAGGEATIKSLVNSGIAHVKRAMAYFGTSRTEEPPIAGEVDAIEKLNGVLVGKIVNAVKFAYDATTGELGATVDNKVATNTEGWATVAAKSGNGKIDAISVKNLDVNTQKLKNFAMTFTTGEDVTVTIPYDYDKAAGNTSYSDLANLKHLVFDVMNTANLMEFDIGGKGTDDVITLDLKVLGINLANIKIGYNGKIKIIKTGEDRTGKPIYKTAAAIELYFDDCTAAGATVVPNCTTRLFFYDDVIYVQGFRNANESKYNRNIGKVNKILYDHEKYMGLWSEKQPTQQMTLQYDEYRSAETANVDYIATMYTVDELLGMMQTDMATFLKEFVFYLVPLSTDFSVTGLDHTNLQTTIIDKLGGSADSSQKTTENTNATIAQIFKGYDYKAGVHALTIGLKELSGSAALGNVDVKLIGMNDGDDDGLKGNVKNNYISRLRVSTAINGDMVNINLGATLRNVRVTKDVKNVDVIESSGLAPTNVTHQNGWHYSKDLKRSYVLDSYNYDRNVLYTLDGTTYLTQDGNALYEANGTFAPGLRRTDSSDTDTWVSDKCDNHAQNEAKDFTGRLWPKFTHYYQLFGYCFETNRDAYYVGIDENGNKYVYRIDNGNRVRMTVKSIATDLLARVEFDASGKILSVTNRPDGAQWQRIWEGKVAA